MITIELSGGLGNQMFQYALGRHLSLKNKTGLSLDASKIGSYKHGKRSYALSPFDISADIITDPAGAPRPSLFRRCADLLKPYYGRSRIVERGQGFDKDILKIKPSGDNIVLSGHWQSERYFRDIEPMIRRDLTLKDPQGADFDSMAARIRSCRSVSLHVRRTDYLIEKHKNVYGMCAKEYYEQAIGLLKDKAGEMTLFVFSDDIGWVKNNMKFPEAAVFVSGNGFEAHQEMMLISLCKHNITANSTFSWWGAWLNGNLDKIVIAPKKWFVDHKSDENGLIPDTWIRL